MPPSGLLVRLPAPSVAIALSSNDESLVKSELIQPFVRMKKTESYPKPHLTPARSEELLDVLLGVHRFLPVGYVALACIDGSATVAISHGAGPKSRSIFFVWTLLGASAAHSQVS